MANSFIYSLFLRNYNVSKQWEIFFCFCSKFWELFLKRKSKFIKKFINSLNIFFYHGCVPSSFFLIIIFNFVFFIIEGCRPQIEGCTQVWGGPHNLQPHPSPLFGYTPFARHVCLYFLINFSYPSVPPVLSF